MIPVNKNNLSDHRVRRQRIASALLSCNRLLKNMIFSCLPAMCFLFLAGETVMAEGNRIYLNSGRVTPAHVYVEIQRVEQLIDQLGLFMGISEPEPLGVQVTNAAPHDVYFQARTLAMKANRLSFELIRKSREPPALPGSVVRPEEVKKMVMEALGAISEVSQKLGLSAVNTEVIHNKAITPSDVFMATMRANRYLNRLLERRFSPDEVYRVVNLAIGYASRLLTQYPGAERIPKKPLYEKNKKPLDVYFRLHECLLLIIKIYQAGNHDILKIDVSGINEKYISPSDVFDMASLIVARLDYLHKKNNISRMPRETYFPGRKFPSDVYQQAAILEQQLTALLSYTEKKEHKKAQ